MIVTLNKISISAIYMTGETERELSYRWNKWIPR